MTHTFRLVYPGSRSPRFVTLPAAKVWVKWVRGKPMWSLVGTLPLRKTYIVWGSPEEIAADLNLRVKTR